jgi:hypothetical protein
MTSHTVYDDSAAHPREAPPAHTAVEQSIDSTTERLNRLTGAQTPLTSVESEDEDHEITDQWNDIGGNWWQGSRAPSFRGDQTDPTEPTGADRSGIRRGAST